MYIKKKKKFKNKKINKFSKECFKKKKLIKINLEKKPLKNGIPAKFNKLKTIQKDKKIFFLKKFKLKNFDFFKKKKSKQINIKNNIFNK
jgi:hypothetical protein